jgi:hypothetical protein
MTPHIRHSVTSSVTNTDQQGAIPPPEPRHGIAELLRLVGAVRRLAFDRTLPPSEAMGRIRDAF